MSEPDRPTKSPNELLRDSSGQIPRLPPDAERKEGDRTTRSVAVGLAGGIVAQTLFPSLPVKLHRLLYWMR